MVRLVREGKHISKIWAEDFSEYGYWEVYTEVYGAGEKSSVGVKRMITARLKKLTGTNKQKDREELIEEINELIFHLYIRYKDSQQKSNEIRSSINNS
ncbi:hypothetical protein [Bacillus toyonensis]